MTPPARRIGIVGTFDLENYGDLLFPLIARAQLDERLDGVDVHPLSYHPKRTPEWPYAVDSVSRLPEIVEALDGLLVGGGFLIRFDKDVAPGYGPPSTGIHHPTGNWLSPALIAQQHGVPVVFNAPGMHCNAIPAWSEPLLRQVLRGSSYVSVRDEPSRAALAEHSAAQIAVVPDTGFGIASLLDARPAEEIDGLRRAAGLTGRYIVVQAALSELPFAQWLTSRAEQFEDLQVLVVPVSPVLGERAESLADAVPGAKTLPSWPHPLALATLIDHAEAVVGHSYHLAITGLCRGVPVFTPDRSSVGKYAALAGFDGLHHAPHADVPAEWFRHRLGKGPVSPQLRLVDHMLEAHWDRIAGVLRGGRTATPPALNRLWQALPGWLEDAVPPNGSAGNGASPAAQGAAPPNGAADAVAALQAECAAQRARAGELAALLAIAREELAAGDEALAALAPVPARSPAERLARATRTLRDRGPARPGPVLDLRPLRAFALQSDPYAWGMIDGLFSAEAAAELSATYPHDLFKRIASRGGEKDYAYHARSLVGMGATSPHRPARLGDAWRRLAGDLLSPGYRNAMSLLVGRDLTHALLEVNVFHYGPGSELGPHPDLPEKIVTHVLYFNRMWNPADGGCLRILRSRDPGDIVSEIPPIVGNSSVIVRSDDSWHAVAPVVADDAGSRRSVTVTFYEPGSTSSMWPPGDEEQLRDYGEAPV